MGVGARDRDALPALLGWLCWRIPGLAIQAAVAAARTVLVANYARAAAVGKAVAFALRCLCRLVVVGMLLVRSAQELA